jgi:hypothetical protein
MPLPRLRIRTLMVIIAVLAPILAVVAWLNQASMALHEFYRPGGTLDRQRAGRAAPPQKPAPAPKLSK